MAKKKSEEVDFDELYASIAATTGGEVLANKDIVKKFIDTGNLSINYSCSGRFITGGIPLGRIIEAYGPEASGKSLIGTNVLASCQRMKGWAILLDCENSSNAEFMQKISHLNLKRVFRYAPSSLERAFRQIHVSVTEIRNMEKSKGIDPLPILIVFDSLTVPPCERELRENNLPLDYNPADWKRIVGRQEQPGERSKIISAEMRKLQSMIAKDENTTVYLINQVRQNIGVMYGNPETTPGGNAVKFYSSLRIRTSTKKKIENKTLGRVSGINMCVRNIKNRSFHPFVVADDVKLYFESGVDPISGLLTALISDKRVTGKGTYSVSPEYLPEGKEEYKFKASKEENRVPLEVLFDCPKLVDAKTSEDVQKYINTWGAGLAATESGDYSEGELLETEEIDMEKEAAED